jgi:hypothetical protein
MKKNICLIVFASFIFTSCGPTAEEIESKVRKDLKKEQDSISTIELEAAKVLAQEEMERVALEEKKRIDIENKNLERFFSNVPGVMVKVNRAYFHSEPVISSIRKSYLVIGDRASIIRMKNGFAYIEFYNQNSGKSTNGWIKLIDFEIDYSDNSQRYGEGAYDPDESDNN